LSFTLEYLGIPGARGLLSDPTSILFTIAAIDFWQWTPFVVLVLLAVRNGLPGTPREAAALDGAGSIRQFLDVTLPAMLPAVFFISVLRFIDSFKEFDKVFILTGGGPGSASELASIYIWRVAFKYWDFGYAAALCVLIYILLYGLFSASYRCGRRTSP